jgi:hypothetical protein
MSYTEADLTKFLSNPNVKIAESSVTNPTVKDSLTVGSLGGTQKKTLVIVLPFKLPTWNVLLAMNHWARKKERDRIHKAVADAVSTSIRFENGLPIQMESAQKQQLTDSCMLESLEMMVVNMSQKSGTHRKRARKKKQ